VSYFIEYAVAGADGPVGGPDLATTRGWYDFGTWALGLGEGYPELAYIAEFGECLTEDGADADALEQLEAELTRTLQERPGDPSGDVLGVGERLLGALRQRPPGTVALIVTDGVSGGDGDDEDPDDEGDDGPGSSGGHDHPAEGVGGLHDDSFLAREIKGKFRYTKQS
jgi:hypothetical protein